MENNRTAIPPQPSNSTKSKSGGASPPLAANNCFGNSSFAPPPGFSAQSNVNFGTQQSQYSPGNVDTSYQNFYPFEKRAHEYGMNENYGLQSGFIGYYNFYPENSSISLPSMNANQQDKFLHSSRLASSHQLNNSVTSNGYDLDKGLNVLLNSANNTFIQHAEYANNNNPNTLRNERKLNTSSNGAIKPILDNLVGSMAMSNGTYTHFGPTGPSIPALQTENVQHYLRPEPKRADNAPLSDTYLNSAFGNFGNGKQSPVFSTIGTGRATPNNESPGSRPHTPGKPSYSEILAKNNATQASSGKKLSSASSSPSANVNQNKSSPGESFSMVHHRKSIDSINISSNSSTASSLCTSASSSPIAKQKSISQSIVGRLFNPMKGKENAEDCITRSTSNFNAKSNAGAVTPTHQKKFATSKSNEVTGNDRKVLTSNQNNNSVKFNKSNSSLNKSKPQTNQGSSGSFDFEIEDLDEEEEDMGWKTYTRGGKNQIIRSKDGKRLSNGNISPSISLHSGNAIDESDNKYDMESMNESSRRDSEGIKRASNSSITPLIGIGNLGGGSGGLNVNTSQRKGRLDKEKVKSRKDNRNCMVRRVERVVYLWAAHMISAFAWLVKLVTDVATLSISVGSTLMEDLYSWWMNKALPTCILQFQTIKENMHRFFRKSKEALKWKIRFRRKSTDEENERKKNAEDLLAALGPDRNIALPTNGDEALKRLLSVRGQDPYSVIGIRSDSTDDTIRRYYKKQAVLVHPDKNLVPGAEEAFKILAKAFELIGEPIKRQEYHHKLLEAHINQQVYGEIGKLLEQLRKKMEIATGSIRCTKCNSRHKKNKTDRPLFAARYCAQCNIHHGAREGELWAERKGWFGLSWNYFACMDCHIWEINEWAKCQKKNLMHIKADSHCVMYRLVAGNGSNQQGQNQSSSNPGADGQFHVDKDDDWDSLIGNLCKSSNGGVPGGKSGSHFYQQGKGTAGSCCPGPATNPSTSGVGRKRKGKRK